MDVTHLREYDGHEAVVFASDPKTGLRAIIAIHNTNRGPATGGTRYWRYSSEIEAARDALRLSRAMTYKCALADVPYGGGKAVIMADPRHPKTPAFLTAYARAVNSFGGRFTTGEDVGMNSRDIRILQKHSRFVNGGHGDLGPWAALGVFSAMQAAVAAVFGKASFRERSVAVKGLGQVGLGLCRLLAAAGVRRLVAADVSQAAVQRAKSEIPWLEVVPPASILFERVDVVAPCALGGDLALATVRRLRTDIVCGGANNQLAAAEVAARLQRAGILYIPDYVANAGGLIQVVGEMRPGGYSKAWVEQKTKAIRRTAARLIAQSVRRRISPAVVADELARAIVGRHRA